MNKAKSLLKGFAVSIFLAAAVLLLYGVATDCAGVVGYHHKDSQDCPSHYR